MLVCHSCDIRACVNPSHLFLGTFKDNVDDMMRKQRGRWLHGSSNPGAKLSDDDVRTIRGSTEAHKILAERFGVSNPLISRIKRGLKWSRLQ